MSELPSSVRPTVPAPRIHLSYIDGLRGFAALYVLFHHAYQALLYSPSSNRFSPIFFQCLKILDFGHYAVDVFIVVSGYCLMLPALHSGNLTLRGGTRAYIARRARRILPPYYAALALSVLVALSSGAILPSKGNELRGDILLSHLSLIHNIVPAWQLSSNPPLWSIAVEWQIYFLFAGLLLPVWKRFGPVVALTLSFFLGLAPHYLGNGLLAHTCPWYLGLFTLGMTAASIGYSPHPAFVWLRERVCWGELSFALWVGLAAFGLLRSGWYNQHREIADPLFGLASLSVLVYSTEYLKKGKISRISIVPVMTSPMAAAIGAYSYSLYLVHFPLLQLSHNLLLQAHPSAVVQAVVMMIIAPLAIIALAYGFYLLVEKRFISEKAQEKRVPA